MRWKFTGNYDNKILTSLELLSKWTIIGLKDTVDLNAKDKKKSTILKKQVNNTSGEFRQNVETPFSVGILVYSLANLK